MVFYKRKTMNETSSFTDILEGPFVARDLRGQTIGKYKIVGEIGRGGFAIVYKAHDPTRNWDVALKVLHPIHIERKDVVERFLAKARRTTKLRHHGIVQIHDLGEDQGRPFIVMEFLPGGNLSDRLPLGAAVTILEQVAEALDYAHREGLVHRDVKPSNILFDKAGHAVLADFFAKVLDESGIMPNGIRLGTPAYMAPEQFDPNAEVGPAADIYALGVVAYEMLTGHVPSRPLSKESLDKGLAQAIFGALAKNPIERPKSAGDFVGLFRARLNQIDLAENLVGQTIGGRYTICELIAEGGTSIIYKARHKKTELMVALKVKLMSKASISKRDKESIRRFKREFKGLAEMEHPNIVPVFDTGLDKDALLDHDTYYIAMRLIEGKTLEERLKILEANGERMAWSEVLNIVQDVAAALDYAHGHELEFVHRDVTPSNIMLVQGTAYLFDFGLLKTLNLPDSTTERKTFIGLKTFTVDGVAMGTPGYWPPEQIEGNRIDRRADIYSLGGVLYRMLTAQRPYKDDPLGIVSPLQQPPPKPSDVDPALIAFDSIVARAMAKDPDRRYQSVGELVQALKTVLALTPDPIRGRELAVARHIVKQLPWWLGGLLAISVAISLTLFIGVRYFDWFRRLPVGWQSSNQGVSMMVKDDNDYSVTVTEGNTSYTILEEGKKLSSPNVSLEGKLISGPQETAFGLIFQYVDDATYCVFAITGDGQVGVWQRKGDRWIARTEAEQSWVRRKYILTDRPNRLEVTIEGNLARGWVNNQPEFEVKLDTSQSGNVGFFVSTAREAKEPKATIRFSNFTVRK